MLSSADLVAFVAVTDLTRARAFYEHALGLAVTEANPAAVVFDAHGTMLRVTLVEQVAAAGYTVLGWSVEDATAVVHQLQARGVAFERFDGMEQDADGLWTAPGGARVAWFKDPDGNTLSVTQHTR